MGRPPHFSPILLLLCSPSGHRANSSRAARGNSARARRGEAPPSLDAAPGQPHPEPPPQVGGGRDGALFDLCVRHHLLERGDLVPRFRLRQRQNRARALWGENGRSTILKRCVGVVTPAKSLPIPLARNSVRMNLSSPLRRMIVCCFVA